MNKFMLSSVALVALSTAAVAADLPSHKAPAAYPAATSATTAKWTGFYVGLNGGYANGTFKDPYVTPVLGNFSATGGLAGLQVGYNHQIDKYVIGVEADYDWANLSASKSAAIGVIMNGNAIGVAAAAIKTTQESLGTARVRIGYTVDNALLYVTGGYAYAKAKVDVSGAATWNGLTWSGAAGNSQSHNGWVLGAGLEYDLGSHISAKAEYLYADLGSKTYWGGTVASDKVSLSANIFRAGLNYRF